MFKILRHLKLKEWIQAVIFVVFVSMQVWLDVELLDFMSEITVFVQTKGSKNDIWKTGGFMLLCAIGSLATAIIASCFSANIVASLSYHLRSDFYNKVESFSMEEIERFSIPNLINLSTNEIKKMETFIALGFQIIIKAPILFVWVILKIADKNLNISISTMCMVFVLFVIVQIIIVLPKYKVIQQHYQEEKSKEANEALTNTNLLHCIMAIMMPEITMIVNGFFLFIFLVGAYHIEGSETSLKLLLFSDMIVYSSYAMQVVMAFVMLLMLFILYPRVIVSARRINEVLDTVSVIADGNLKIQPWVMGELEFKNVSFKYPNSEMYALHNVSFKAEAGELVALIGSSRSGKSTLVNLVPRFYDVTEGEIFMNGVNIKQYKQKDLHNKIGFVPQKAILFQGTVSSNVAFGENGKKSASIEDVKSAIEISQSRDFVELMEHSYEAEITQSGNNLSNEQKQQLCIARAICRKPEIFIFDDFFSTLDYKTDRELRQELKKLSFGTTTFIATQRIGTIRNADKIIVLEEGNVVGIGNHKELIKNCNAYREIAYAQLSKEAFMHESEEVLLHESEEVLLHE